MDTHREPFRPISFSFLDNGSVVLSIPRLFFFFFFFRDQNRSNTWNKQDKLLQILQLETVDDEDKRMMEKKNPDTTLGLLHLYPTKPRQSPRPNRIQTRKPRKVLKRSRRRGDKGDHFHATQSRISNGERERTRWRRNWMLWMQ